MPVHGDAAAAPCMTLGSKLLHKCKLLISKVRKKIIIILRKIQVEAPQTPISFFFHPKGKMRFKVLHIILSDSSFALKLNEVQ